MTRLDEIKKRAEAASPGPWDFRSGLGWFDVHAHPYLHNSGNVLISVHNGTPENKRDADFIAHAREDVPWLLAQLEAAQNVVEAARFTLTGRDRSREGVLGKAIDEYDAAQREEKR